ncbi:hypothetical protein QJS10_CPB18g00228 [Acorus calamus]|uniref:Uncharacterized protein n=1 Tax=Acorus calamus TaxID=4465 RepID=A0AAV9CPF5_ACOCL|nr:hypothetical protein QJS10_CPB18g00228 [Acorus calamus]
MRGVGSHHTTTNNVSGVLRVGDHYVMEGNGIGYSSENPRFMNERGFRDRVNPSVHVLGNDECGIRCGFFPSTAFMGRTSIQSS